jgi:hypothetical protein
MTNYKILRSYFYRTKSSPRLYNRISRSRRQRKRRLTPGRRFSNFGENPSIWGEQTHRRNLNIVFYGKNVLFYNKVFNV